MLTNYLGYANAQTTQLDPSKTYTTGNIVVNTPQGGPSSWVNAVYQNNLTCWRNGDPGYCGPNAIVGPNNNFNFSYGSTYVYQQQAVSGLLPNSGNGLVVSGYNFSFTAKNGNGWDDGRIDNLTALVRFWDTTGGRAANNLVYGNVYNLTYKFNWSNFNYSENFPIALSATSIGQVQYGFIGKDNNNWAGPYGPEVKDISFRLKYTVDPCSVDPTSSTKCPGYVEAILKLTPKSVTTNETPTTQTAAGIATIVTTPSVISAATTEIAAAVATPTVSAAISTISAPVVSSSTSSTSVTPTANNPQPKVGEVTVSGSPAKTTMSSSQLLSIVRNEQSRIGSLETSTSQQAVEQTQAASDKAQNDSISVSMATLSQSQSASQSIATMFATNPSQAANNNASTTNNNTSSSVANLTPTPNKVGTVDVLKQPEASASSGQTTTSVSKPIEVKLYEPPQVIVESPQASQPKPQNIYSLTTPTFIPEPAITVAAMNQQSTYTLPKIDTNKIQDEQPKTEGIKLTGFNAFLNPTNNTQTPQTQTNESTNESAVNTNVANNDLAKGGVDISSIAVNPAGFSAYMSLALKDGQLYKPEEIYRNQVTVDNVRALRQLSSDRVHQEMVNQQYRN